MITAYTTSGNKFIIDFKEGKTVVNGEEVEIDQIVIRPGTFHWLIGNKSYKVELIDQPEPKKFIIRINGKVHTITLKDKMDDLLHELGMDNLSSQKVNDLKAPMPGLVVDIKVKEGDEIRKGDTIIVLEAMKMENALKATADAKVKKISVIKGAAVEKNAVLVYLE